MAQRISLATVLALCALAGSARAQDVTVDALILYTPGAVQLYGSVQGVETRINHLVGVTNQIYEDSQVAITLRAVHIAQVGYNDTAESERALKAITNATDQFVGDPAFAGVEELRRQYGADVVVLMRPYVNDKLCGVAWVGGLPGGSFPDSRGKNLAYSHVTIDCSDYVLAHELGHNMGLLHSRRQDFHGPTFDYALGYGVDNVFVDVMAYSQDFNAVKVYKFSSPLLSCMGRPCGVDASDAENSADAARALNSFREPIASYLPAPALTDPLAGDFDGDGDADIFWLSATGRAQIDLLQRGRSGVSVPVQHTLGPGWRAQATGDFDADGDSDVVLRNIASGELQLWLMRGARISDQSGPMPTVADLNWQIAGAGDFDGDGKDDLVWRHRTTGQTTLWTVEGRTLGRGTGSILAVDDPAWRIAQVADFDGDGRADLLWRNASTGENKIFKMNGISVSQSGPIPTVADLNWGAVAAGDVNGDGFADIVWRNRQTGENAYWLMNGLVFLPGSSRFFPIPDSGWSIRGTGDFNADGRSDILWSHTNGMASYFVMSGNGPVSGRVVINPR